jgi:hypothetical protein
MNTATIRQKLFDYIRVAEDKKIRAIYTMVEDEMQQMYAWWEDDELIKDLDRRSKLFKEGKEKGRPWENVKEEILKNRKTSIDGK